MKSHDSIQFLTPIVTLREAPNYFNHKNFGKNHCIHAPQFFPSVSVSSLLVHLNQPFNVSFVTVLTVPSDFVTL